MAALITYLALAGYILGRFANNAFPTYYLERPLLLVVPLAIVIGLLAAWATWMRHLDEILLAAAILAVLLLLAWWRWHRIPSLPRAFSTAATAFVVVFFLSGVARAVLSAEGPITPVTVTATATGPNLYLVLLDAYPRRDTLLKHLTSRDDDSIVEAAKQLRSLVSKTKTSRSLDILLAEDNPVNALLARIFNLEASLLRWVNFPFGVSVLLIAQRPR